MVWWAPFCATPTLIASWEWRVFTVVALVCFLASEIFHLLALLPAMEDISTHLNHDQAKTRKFEEKNPVFGVKRIGKCTLGTCLSLRVLCPSTSPWLGSCRLLPISSLLSFPGPIAVLSAFQYFTQTPLPPWSFFWFQLNMVSPFQILCS